MVSEEIHIDHEAAAAAPTLSKFRQFKLRVPSINTKGTGLDYQRSPTPRLLDFLKARPSRDWLLNFRLSSPLAVFRRTVNRREEISLSTPSPAGGLLRIRRFHVRFLRKIDWSSVLRTCRGWLLQPLNIALLVWLLSVAAVAVFLGLLLLGAFNRLVQSKPVRSNWVETCNQIINALFTLMSLYQHPTLLHHLFLLLRWTPEDVVALRKVYCKDGAYRVREWFHMMVVAFLLQLAFFAQYALCAVYWLYPSKMRPEYLENIFGGVGILATVVAGVYTLYSPLGREYSLYTDEEDPPSSSSRNAIKSAAAAVAQPEWAGGLFDCGDDATVARLSFFCTCCVFGWNMERLGFGNMYVHIVTFVLLCIAPFWIFSTTALKINNVVVDNLMWALGVLLCLLGLMYGGFWRTEMRRKFGLPGSDFCCGSAALTDYFQWMFCWPCSLAQEVRTGNFYDVEDDSLCRKLLDIDEEERQMPGEDGGSGTAERSVPELLISIAADDSSVPDSGVILIPPVQTLIQFDGHTVAVEEQSQSDSSEAGKD
ncbi:uncharacterized protein M6B38_184240 [Iris pallida]|uniref:Uncharacterized protein n=1 Tax=Iris pallida TaxID=29817 RepID=A0AAX6EKU1_IRIPA|nr:uncharacterized protein M6B38_184240 [Iris pallida]